MQQFQQLNEHSVENLKATRQEREHQNSKQVKLSLLADDVILHVKSPQYSTKT